MKLNELSTLRLALLARETRAQSARILRADPIAVVGMACRTPGGGDTPAKLWELISEGRTTDSEVPSDRFDVAAWHDSDPATPGRMVTRRGSFLDRIDQFDPDYFGILQREADQMDPQQRLALQVAIEALDDAGIPHHALEGSRTGVFMACYHSDYMRLVYDSVEGLDTRSLTGVVHGVVANRISHFLDLRGPSLTLDTGCSSSLVAIHLACQSLRAGETDLSLAGGVSLMITPELFVAMTKVGFMSPDGRCKTFEACADGFGRGEGCGVVALKRLSDAVADGDRVLGVIRSTVVNQDGHSTVLTAPNGKAQEAMIREALSSAAIAPERVVYVEAHGTGTELGDPIEIEAIANVLGAQKPDAPACFVGSAKANLGHLEAAAGVVGLIKTVEVLRHRMVPSQPAMTRVSPHISLAGTRLRIPTKSEPIAAGPLPPCGAVSSFGIGGTNAHVVLEPSPDVSGPEPVEADAPWVLPLSAKTLQGLRALGERWLELLARDDGASIADLCHTASQRRTHYSHRIAVAGRSKAELRSALAAALAKLDGAPAFESKPRIGFVFSGQGPQWWAMGRELMQAEPVFAEAMAECDVALRPHCGWSIIDELSRPESETRIADTFIAQPALFALQTSLARLWRSWGVEPAAVVGHSVGEIAALHVAGVLSLAEAARVVATRGAIMQAATGAGRMTAVEMDETAALAFAAEFAGRLDIAAINAPRSVVLSGEPQAIAEATARLVASGVAVRDLNVPYAFHSAQMQPLADQLARELGQVSASRADIRAYSTLTGAELADGACDARYFADAVRRPVRFGAAIGAMHDAGISTFVEIGPHPVLAAAMNETLAGRKPSTITHSLRRGRDEPVTMRNALAAIYAAGVEPDWPAIQPGEGEVVSLPAYPWQLHRCWLPARSRKRPDATTNSWLGRPVEVAPASSRQTIVPVDFTQWQDWLDDHRIFGEVVVPGVGVVLAMAAASATVRGMPDVELRDVQIREPARLGAQDEAWQIVVTDEGAAQRVALWARSHAVDWRVVAEASAHAHGGAPPVPSTPADSSEAPARFVDTKAFYDSLDELGIGLGPAFQAISRATVVRATTHATATLPAAIAATPSPHPVLLDACLQAATMAARDGDADSRTAYIPMSFDRVAIATDRTALTTINIEAKLGTTSPASISASIVARDEQGNAVVEFGGARLVRASADAFRAASASPADAYTIEWTVAETLSVPARTAAWVVLADIGGAADCFAEAARSGGARVVVIRPELENIPKLLRDLASDLGGASIACFWPLDIEHAERADGAAEKLLSLVRAVAAEGAHALTLVTAGALMPRHGAGEAATRRSAAMAALFRVAAAENALLDLRIVDLDPLSDPRTQGSAALHALDTTSRSEIAVRGEQVFAQRFRSESGRDRHMPLAVRQTSEGLSGVVLAPFAPPAPTVGEVLIEVAAAGVNFRDTLVALGAYVGEPVPFGVEAAGVIRAVGSGVTDFKPGDRVVAFAPACMATHAVVRASQCARIPDGVPFDVAASLPAAFVTADIALNRFARIARGDRVLVHAATGGVGLAVIALAERAGAEIFATAGTPEKRAYLRRRGIVHVFDSRSPRFAQEIMAATGGSGVQVAVNSLIGPLKDATLRVIATGGTFIELGKREAWTADDVAGLRADVKYAIFDAGAMAAAAPELFARPVEAALKAIAVGELAPLPIETHPLADAREVFQRMAQARHLGKIVLCAPAPPAAALSIREEGAYLITGGHGGIGLAAARWLVDRGARHIWLVGRSPPGEVAAREIAEMRERGATVRSNAVDIADEERLRGVLSDVASAGLSLCGIVHAAGVAGEGLIADIDAGRLDEARRGKVEGAIALRHHTRGMPLDFVVLSSSLAGLLGASGQGAYAAANAELEMLAWQWRADGVPVYVIPWGPWSDAGMFASAAEQTRAIWQSRGVVAMPARRALSRLGRVLAGEAAHVVVAQVDWSRVASPVAPPVAIERSPPRAAAAPQADPLATLRGQAVSLVRPALVDLLTTITRRVLGLPEHVAIDTAAPLKNMGLDSLMAIELRNELARVGGVALPATIAFDLPTLDALADHLTDVWKLTPAAVPAAQVRTVGESAANENDGLDELSDEDAEALLAAELDALAEERTAVKVNI